MKTIEPFIKLGWHTVPLKGKLERLKGGKKTIPSFESGWKEHYQSKFNEVKSKLGGAITGKCSGIIAIDCDNTDTYNMFKGLDPDYEFVFKSKGKGYVAGTIIYKFTDVIPFTFSLADNDIALDVYANNGFVYLPTETNKTKEPFKLVELKEIPAATLLLLKQLYALKNRPLEQLAAPANISTGNCLAPLVEQFTKIGEYMPGLFRIITPKDFRKEKDYMKNGHLHPDKVPQGRGSEYMSKISAILGKDPSISEELYVDALHSINNLWADPIDASRLDQTIIDPILSGKASIDGIPIWQYDKTWQKHRLVLHTKRQANVELGFDDNRNYYYCVDIINEHVKGFSHDAELQSYVDSVAINPPKKAELKRSLPIINVVSNPGRSFGFHIDNDPSIKTLNTFVQTPELNILNNPEDYKEFYKRPETIIKFFNSLVPEAPMREYLLSFTKRKLMAFEYSPVILYFMGVHGSGKDTYVALLEKIIPNLARPTVKEFLEKNNAWLLDTYFVQLDEYGNQLTRLSDKEEALGKLKAYTGKPQVQIREMRNDGFPYKHNATFVMTANKNPLMLEEGDRRVAFFPTPNILSEQDWVIQAGGIYDVHKKIMSEVKDFCYYLATEVEMLSGQAYVSPPNSDSKLTLIADSMYAASRLAYVMKNNMWDYLKDLATEHGTDEIKEALKRQQLTQETFENLYDIMTDMNGDVKALTKAVRNIGITVHTINKGGTKDYSYEVFKETSPFKREDNE